MLHLNEVGGQKKSRAVFDGVYLPVTRRSQTRSAPAAVPPPPNAPATAPAPPSAPRAPTPGPGEAPVAPVEGEAPKNTGKGKAPELPAAQLGPEAPAHPFAGARAVTVDVTQKPPALPTRNPARTNGQIKPVMKLHDAKALDRVQRRFLDKEIMVTGSDLLSISPDLAKRLHDGTTVRRVMFRDPLADESATVDKMIAGMRSETTGAVTTAYLEELPGTSDSEEEEEIEASILAQANVGGKDTSILAHPSLGPEREAQHGDDESVVVGRPLSSLRTIWALVGNSAEHVECILDPGSQIVAISENLCDHLHLVYNPANMLGMESANGQVNRSLGVAVDVPLVINGTGITLYLQMHVMRDAAYGVLLGRPFDNLASTIVEQSPDGIHRLTIRCPNSRRVAVVPTYNRGEGRPPMPGPSKPVF